MSGKRARPGAQCDSRTGGGRYRCERIMGHDGPHRCAHPHLSWSDSETRTTGFPEGLADHIAFQPNGWAVRFNGAVQEGRWRSWAAAFLHLTRLQEGARAAQPEGRA